MSTAATNAVRPVVRSANRSDLRTPVKMDAASVAQRKQEGIRNLLRTGIRNNMVLDFK